jgi:hypothetical protein
MLPVPAARGYRLGAPMTRPAPSRPPARPPAGPTPGQRQRRRWALVVVLLTVLSGVVVVGGGYRLLLATAPDMPIAANAGDRAVVGALRLRLRQHGDRVALAELLPGVWDTVCVIHPFELSSATLDEALAAGGMAARAVAVPEEQRHVPDPNWLLVTLDGARLAQVVHVHHREVDIASGPVCAGRAQARLAAIAVEPGHPLRIALER